MDSCLDDGVWDRGHAVIIGLNYDGKSCLVSAYQSRKICNHIEGRELISIRDLQRLCKGCQAIVTKSQGLGCKCVQGQLCGLARTM